MIGAAVTSCFIFLNADSRTDCHVQDASLHVNLRSGSQCFDMIRRSFAKQTVALTLYLLALTSS